MEHQLILVRDWLTAFDGLTIYGVCFGVLLLCGFGLPIPEDITLLICGYLTYRPMPDGTPRPHVNIIASLFVGLAGVLIGDSTMFSLGGRFGERLRSVRPFSYILGHGRLEKTEEFLQSHGPKVLFSARFTPGLRSVVFFSSGVLKIPYKTFLFYDGLAALISVPALVLSAWHWGPDFEDVLLKARKAENGMLFLILGVAALLLARWYFSHRKRKRGKLPPS